MTCSAFFAAAALVAALKTPETSSLFVRHTDAKTGVVSYLLKPGSVAFNQQSLYFTVKSMTDDGRFLLFMTCDDEFPPEQGGRHVNVKRRLRLVDFLKDEILDLGPHGASPFIDVKTDQMWIPGKNGICRRDLLVDPVKDIVLCPWPAELANRFGTHITPDRERRTFFIDTQYKDGRQVEGVIDTVTGKFTEWTTADFFCNHGQFNLADPTLAMCAWEYATSKVKSELYPDELARAKFDDRLVVSDIRRSPDDEYPRLWLFRRGKKWEVSSKITGYASHEYFAEDGRGFYWCSAGVSYHDLATGREWRIDPLGSAHAAMTADNRYIVSDSSLGGWWRGCSWSTLFWNRVTHRGVYIHSRTPKIAEKDNQSTLHPDPHPQFVCRDRYIVSTMNDDQRRMNLSVTPVDQLVAITTDPATAPVPKDFEQRLGDSMRTDVTYEMKVDVDSLRKRKLVSEPPCAVISDSYTAFALKAVVKGETKALPFEAVQGGDWRRNVVLRFRLPEGVERLYCVADAPGRFEYYDSESCANLLWNAYLPENAGKWELAPGVKGEEHRAGLLLVGESRGGSAADGAYTVALPDGLAGKDFKFELNLRNLAEADFTGGIRLVALDGKGAALGDLFAGKGLDGTLARDRRREFRFTGTFPSEARKVRLEVVLKSADGTPAKALIHRLNLREATVFAFTPPS